LRAKALWKTVSSVSFRIVSHSPPKISSDMIAPAIDPALRFIDGISVSSFL
jgi:hypothetical protein